MLTMTIQKNLNYWNLDFLYKLALRVTLYFFRLALWGYSVTSLPRALCFALLFSVALLPEALCFALAFSVASLPRALDFAICACLLGHFAPSSFKLQASSFSLTKSFNNKRCVSIDSKCSETQRNAK